MSNVRNNYVSDLQDKICELSKDEQALLLQYFGIRWSQLSCLAETNIRWIARKYKARCGERSKQGIIFILELLLKELKE